MKKTFKPFIALVVIVLAALVLASCAGGQLGNSFFPGVFSSPRFLYNVGDNDVTGFTVNRDTGALSKIAGSPFSSGSFVCPDHAVADPAGRFLFLANCNGDVVVYQIGTDGALSEIAGSPFTGSGCDPEVPAMHPSGKYLYISDECEFITAFSIGSDGSLTELPGSPFSVNGDVSDTVGLTATPDGRYLYVGVRDSVSGNGGIQGFSIAADGSLTDVDSGNIAPEPGTGAESPVLGVDPYSRFVYAVDPDSDTVFSFKIDSSTGKLAAAQSASTIDRSPRGIAVSPNGKLVVVANGGDFDLGISGSVVGYYVDPNTGAFTTLTGSPYTTAGPNPLRVAIDGTSHWVYVSIEDAPGICCGTSGDGTNGIFVYKIDWDHGTLVAGPGPFNTSKGPESITIVH